MTTLLVDAGNSRLKWALLSNGQRTAQTARQHAPSQPSAATLEYLHRLLKQTSPKQLLMVHVFGQKFSHAVQQLCKDYHCSYKPIVSHSPAYGLTLAYPKAEHLGADRFVGLLAARKLAPQQATIIIDCGTAVTIDVLRANGEHLGGLILPGLNMMSEALTQRTEASHMIEPIMEPVSLLSNNTRQAMGSGCVLGLASAVDGICQRLLPQLAEPCHIILCGGDAEHLHDHITVKHSVNADALMAGLHYIAEQEEERACRSC